MSLLSVGGDAWTVGLAGEEDEEIILVGPGLARVSRVGEKLDVRRPVIVRKPAGTVRNAADEYVLLS